MYSVHVLLIVVFIRSLRHFHSFILKILLNQKSNIHLSFFFIKSIPHIVYETKIWHECQANDLSIFEYINFGGFYPTWRSWILTTYIFDFSAYVDRCVSVFSWQTMVLEIIRWCVVLGLLMAIHFTCSFCKFFYRFRTFFYYFHCWYRCPIQTHNRANLKK